MKRRDFLRLSGPMAATPLLLHATPVRAFSSLGLKKAMNCSGINERALVVIQLSGGNDGVNTIIPIDQYATYASLRPDIRIPDSGANSYINLDTSLPVADQIGLHPSMQAVKSLYDDGKANIIQSVSYTNHNRSHFKSTDLWLSGGDGTPANFNIPTGWMGRYLNQVYPGSAGNPTPAMPDPLGLQLGETKPSLGFHTESEHAVSINLTGQNPGGFFNLVSEIGGAPVANVPASEYGAELQYIMGVENSIGTYAQRITDVFNAGSNSAAVTYPNFYLADQLKTVARLINGGCRTKIFLVSIGGFDTHVNQVESTNSTQGQHANLLTQLSESVLAFQNDLAAMSKEEQVLTVTFSEFGRKAAQNGNFGTDHGTIAPMMLFGSGVNGGVTGTNVDLSNLIDNSQLQNPQHDYRQVYATLLQDWLGAADTVVTAAGFGGYTTQKLELVAPAQTVDPICYSESLLPVDLVYFKAEVTANREVLLTWETSSEQNSQRFVLERSTDARAFLPIKEVAAAGNSSGTQIYQEVDTEPFTGTSYYRLKQMDFDGSAYFYNVVSVFLDQTEVQHTFRAYPIPASETLFFDIYAVEESNGRLQILGIHGALMREQAISLSRGSNTLDLDVSSLAPGQYMARLRIGKRKILTRRIIVTR